jgi:hypothetical protein
LPARLFAAHPRGLTFLNLAIEVVLQLFVEFPLNRIARRKRPEPKANDAMQAHIYPLASARSHYLRNRGRETLPLRSLAIENLLPGLGHSVVLGAPIVLADRPF